MVLIGEDQTFTAMAKTVGLPVAIAALKILNREITNPGVQLPITKRSVRTYFERVENLRYRIQEKHVPTWATIPIT